MQVFAVEGCSLQEPGIDDCDGRTDEAEPVYYPGGNNNWDDGFLLEVDVDDPRVLEVYGPHRGSLPSSFATSFAARATSE